MVLLKSALVLAPYTALTQLQKQVKHHSIQGNAELLFLHVRYCVMSSKASAASTDRLIQIRIN